jgi:hypothetical protein
MVNAEIYKADPNENLFIQSRGMSPNPNEMPWPDPSEKDVVYLAWSNYTKGYAAGWAAAKAALEGTVNGTLHSLWHFDWHCSLGWRCCVIYEEGVLN